MGYRSFTDSLGTDWQAWDIVPRLAERRGPDRRVASLAVARERRQAMERRGPAGERNVLRHGLQRGWLCFEATLEKRRLAPVPADWLECTVARLEEYLRSAVPVSRVAVGPTMIELLNRRAG